MTQDEYISAWLQYMKDSNLLSMYDRNLPYLVPGVQRTMNLNEREDMRKELERVNLVILKKLDGIKEIVSDAISNGYNLDYLVLNNKEYTDILDNIWQNYRYRDVIKDNLKYGVVSNGANCIYNATYNLHPAYLNTEVLAHPEKYGLKIVDRPEQRGDIVIATSPQGNHGMVATGEKSSTPELVKAVWSRGGVGDDLMVAGNYPIKGNVQKHVLDFVGNHEDSVKAIDNYNKGVEIPKVQIKPAHHHSLREMMNVDIESNRDIQKAIDAGILQGGERAYSNSVDSRINLVGGYLNGLKKLQQLSGYLGLFGITQ